MFLRKIKLLFKIILVIILFAISVEFIYRASLKTKSYFLYSSKQKDFNLCMVGGSTSKGIPFSEKLSIPQIVSYAFQDSIKGQKISIHNLSEAGMPISTAFWQTRQLALGLDSATMLLYVGINDPYLNTENRNLSFFKFMHHSWVISKIYYLINPWNSSKQHYEFYYEEIVKMLQKKGWTIINSSLVGNYRGFAPNLYNEAYYNSYKKDLDNISKIDKNNAILYEKEPFSYYLKAKKLLNANLIDSANYYFKLAVDQDYSIRPSTFKNNFIKKIALEYELNPIDPNTLFLAKSNQVLPGYNLFMDAHHPNVEGYIFISDLFIKEVEKINGITKKQSTSLSEIETHFLLDKDFYEKAYLETAAWHLSESFFSLYYQDRVNKAAEFIKQSNPNADYSKNYNFWYCLLLLLQEDFEAWNSFYKNHYNIMDYSYSLKGLQNFDRVKEKINLGLSKSLISEELAKEYLSKIN